MRTVFRCKPVKVFTKAPTKEVFPVPAYPFSKKTEAASPDSRKSDKYRITVAWFPVGWCGKFWRIRPSKELFIILSAIIFAIKIAY
jgi:hypothetical protein